MTKEDQPHQELKPAGEIYDQYAQYYDMMTLHHVEDLPLYQQLAINTSPPYLEVGSGTGRVISYLLSIKPVGAKGHYLTGVDVSDEMLAISKRKTTSFIDEGSLHLANHDFSHSPLLEQKFRAAFVTFFTFNYIPEANQLDFLVNIGQSLQSNGIITLDCFSPYLKWHPESAGQWRQVITNNSNIRLQEMTEMMTDTIEKRDWVFTSPGEVTDKITTYRTYVSPEKGKNLLQSAGFTDVRRLSDYELPGSDDFTEGSQVYNFVLTARKP